MLMTRDEALKIVHDLVASDKVLRCQTPQQIVEEMMRNYGPRPYASYSMTKSKMTTRQKQAFELLLCHINNNYIPFALCQSVVITAIHGVGIVLGAVEEIDVAVLERISRWN